MNTKLINISYDDPIASQLAAAAKCLSEGGLCAFPTETVYGLGGSALDASAAEKIYAAKGRPSDNPLIVHISSPADAEKYAVTGELYQKLARAFMPGPLTVVMPKRDIVPLSVTGGLDTVGIRCPGHPVARELIRMAGVPIAAPSANRSGRPSPTTAAHCMEDLNGKVEYIIDGGESEVGLESTIVKIVNDGLVLLRPGAITPDMLREITPNVTIDAGVLESLPEGVAPQAPGMKYRHYAPRAKVYLLRDGGNGEFDRRVVDFLHEQLEKDPSTGILCFDEYASALCGENVLTFGKKDDEHAHSHLLFDRLRQFDSTDAPVIYATAGTTDGIGLALYNRMLKAAGYTVIFL